MQHTIYFGRKKLILTASWPDDHNNTDAGQQRFISDQTDPNTIAAAIDHLGRQEVQSAVLVHSEPDLLLEAVKRQFTFIEAAGGLVFSEQGKILMIFRRGKWDLPKGKLDEGETLEACAVREVMEETGLQHVELVRPLTVTYHTYYQDGQPCLKASYWYLMRARQNDALTPQADEDIDQCLWAEPSNLEEFLNNTHPSIADVLQLIPTEPF